MYDALLNHYVGMRSIRVRSILPSSTQRRSNIPDPNITSEVSQHENNLVRCDNRDRAGHHRRDDHFAERENFSGLVDDPTG